MSRILLLSDIVTRCQQRSDLENSGFISSSEWKGLISTVYGQLHKLLVHSGMRYFETTQSISSASLTDDTNGGGYIALPSDFLSTLGVDRLDGDRWRALMELMAQERNIFTAPGGSFAQGWHHRGGNLHLCPKPPSGQTYRHVYITQPPDLSAAADATQVDVVVPDGEDFLIWGVARLALAKQQSDTSGAEREWARAQEALADAAQDRALLNARRRMVDFDDTFVADPADWRQWRW